jgi:hypothetical protein
MQAISVDEVFEKMTSVLKRRAASLAVVENPAA